MANVPRVKVKLKYQSSPNPSKEERERAFKGMFTAFKRQCADYGIAALSKKYERYEKPSEEKNRKKRERALEISKEKRRNQNPRNKQR